MMHLMSSKASKADPADKAENADQKNPHAYVSLSNYLIPDAVSKETLGLMQRLAADYKALDVQYQERVDEKWGLEEEYEGFVAHGGTTKGLSLKFDETTDRMQYINDQVRKVKEKEDKELKRVKDHNAKVRAKQNAIDVKRYEIAAKMRRLVLLSDIIIRGTWAPMTVDTAAIIGEFPEDKQLILLSMLTKGARARFDDGNYDTSDPRVVAELLRTAERVELI